VAIDAFEKYRTFRTVNQNGKCTHKKDSLHVFWMLRVIYKKTERNRRFFFKTEPKPNRTRGFYQNRTETEPNLKNPFRTSLRITCLSIISRCKVIWSQKQSVFWPTLYIGSSRVYALNHMEQTSLMSTSHLLLINHTTKPHHSNKQWIKVTLLALNVPIKNVSKHNRNRV